MSKKSKPRILESHPTMTSMNISLPEAVKKAVEDVPTWEHPSASAYVISVLVKDLVARNLLIIAKD